MKKANKEVDEHLEVAIHSVSNLLSNLLKTRATLHSRDDLYMAMSPLQDSIGCVNHLQETLGGAEKVIRATLPARPQRSKGLKVTPKDLVRFDPVYFDYFEGGKEFTKNALLCHLATWAFDDGDAAVALKEIKTSFGEKVAAIIRQKLRDRDHDT